MSINYDGTIVKSVNYNGVNINKIYYNDVLVFQSWDGSVLGNLEKFPASAWDYTKGAETNNNYMDITSTYIQAHSYDPQFGSAIDACIPVDVTDCRSLTVYGTVVATGPYYNIGGVYMGKTPYSEEITVDYNKYDQGNRWVWTSPGSGNCTYDYVYLDVSQLTGIYYINICKGHWPGYVDIRKMYFEMLYDEVDIKREIISSGYWSIIDETCTYSVKNLWTTVYRKLCDNNSGQIVLKYSGTVKIIYELYASQDNIYCGTTGQIRHNGNVVISIGGTGWNGDKSDSGEKIITVNAGDTIDFYGRADYYYVGHLKANISLQYI